MFEKVKRMLNFDNVADQQQKQADIERMLEEVDRDWETDSKEGWARGQRD